MAKLDILHFPDPRLRRKAAPVTEVDERIRSLVDDMFETMYAAPGIGLAAVQVNVLERVITIDVSETHDEPLVLINAQVLDSRGEIRTDEGCLSVPETYDLVTRAEWVRFEALGRDGEPYEMEAEGLLAVCVQHEIDHLDGRLFVDHLSSLKRQRIRKKLEKQQRLAS
jgi:peptide deformylase